MGTSKFGRRGAAVSGVPGIMIRSNAWSGTPWHRQSLSNLENIWGTQMNIMN